MAKIAVLGAGTFGVALAVMAQTWGNEVTVWSHSQEESQELQTTRCQTNLPNVKIPDEMEFTADLACVKGCDLVIIAVPSFAVRSVCRQLAAVVEPQTIISCVSKGLEKDTYKDFAAVMEEELPHNACVVLSGPSHAEEVGRGVPTTIVSASRDRHAAERVQDILMNPTFRIYISDDVVGVELGGALKNIIALSAGICDGLTLGDNPKAALMTRGITEIARLGVALGGKQETFAGLSGIGDLIVTCTSMHSRNRRFGILVGQGVPTEEALKQVGMVVEGYSCTKIAYELAQKLHVEMPIVTQAYEVLYQGKNPKDAIRDLMSRPKRDESEEIWLDEKESK